MDEQASAPQNPIQGCACHTRTQLIKYGVVSTADLVDDLMTWRRLYIGERHVAACVLLDVVLPLATRVVALRSSKACLHHRPIACGVRAWCCSGAHAQAGAAIGAASARPSRAAAQPGLRAPHGPASSSTEVHNPGVLGYNLMID